MFKLCCANAFRHVLLCSKVLELCLEAYTVKLTLVVCVCPSVLAVTAQRLQCDEK